MKDCLLLAPLNMTKYKASFDLFKRGIMKVGGYTTHTHFSTPDMEDTDIGYTLWVTTMTVDKEDLKIDEKEYDSTRYENYDAINVNSLRKIPINYASNIGVPITYLMQPNSGYEIIDILNQPIYKGRKIYTRLIIRAK